MKQLACLGLAVFLMCSSAAAQERVPARLWRAAKVVEMRALKTATPVLRTFVGVRFHYRSERVERLRPTWFSSAIWSHGGDPARGDFDYIPVMVAEKDVEAFRRFPSSFKSAGSFVVYGQVLQDVESEQMFLRLVGTKVKRGPRGERIVSW